MSSQQQFNAYPEYGGAGNSAAPSTLVKPIRRDLSFELPADKVNSWHREGLHMAHFLNALSIFFPLGERFFIDSVRNYRARIEDPQLLEEVREFIGQEAMHSREHDIYNKALTAQGYPADKLERVVGRVLKFFTRYTSKAQQLEGTMALEHLTAVLANFVLTHPDLFAGSDERYAKLWRWHAIEETEHKAVAFDVFRAVKGRETPLAYVKRIVAFIISNVVFWPLVFYFHLSLVARDKALLNIAGWGRVLKQFLWKPGIFIKTVPGLLAYFKYNFHPWDHDNRDLLTQIDDVLPHSDNSMQASH